MAKCALCIGINDYPGTESDLNGCVNDAKDWAAAFSKHGFSVTTLFDKKATGANLRAAIGSLMTNANEGDCLAVHYSGHGSYVPDENGDEPDGFDECICPCDISTKGPITDDELFELYSSRPTGVRLFIASDSCHSGTVARMAPVGSLPAPSRGRVERRRLVRFLPPSVFLKGRELAALGAVRPMRRSSPPGRHTGLLFAGCQDYEYSFDGWFNGRANGAFTYVALKTLNTLSKNATYLDWFMAIRGLLPSRQYPQTPNLFGSAAMKKAKVFCANC
jgi:metacaspase-1